ncbi:outer membrane protein assembly factor BamB family protein [Haloterrigena gelatinilytica]|uniref:outer membrane protein assembly factor BamB family protein n=1 Tax=Haloterrigena gelatinilytica TaxID=2741724 RepID=UPI0037420EAA
MADGTVYQGGLELVALSAVDGERLWSKDFGNAVTAPPTVTDDACYVPLGDGTVAALERDGALRWRRQVERGGHGSGMNFVTSPAIAGGTLYVTNAWQLAALDAETGREQWSVETGNDHPVIADGVVYVSGLNAIAAYDGSDGSELWRYRPGATSGGGERVAPVVGGVVFYPSAGLHALRGSDTSGST